MSESQQRPEICDVIGGKRLISCGLRISGRHDLPSDARAFSLTSFEA